VGRVTGRQVRSTRPHMNRWLDLQAGRGGKVAWM